MTANQSNRLNIGTFIARGDSFGGAQRHVLDLSTWLDDRGHHVTVYAGSEGPLTERLHKAGIQTEIISDLSLSLVDPISDIRSYRTLRDLLKNQRPDILTLHSSKSGVVGRFAARSLGIPSIYTLHGVAFGPGVSPLQRSLALGAELLLSRATSSFIAVSEYDRNTAIRYHVARSSKIQTIHNGLPEIDIPIDPVQPPGRRNTKLVMSARFQVPKRHDLVLAALAQMTDFDWTLRFLGDGPGEAHARRLVDRYDLGSRVEFHGFVGEVDAHLNWADVALLISDREGLPLSIIEAFRSARPVVASSVGGIPELVSSENGWLAKAGSLDSLVEVLSEVVDPMTDLGLRSKKARLTYESAFRLDTFCRKTEREYLCQVADA